MKFVMRVVAGALAGFAGLETVRFFEIPSAYVLGGIALVMFIQLGMRVDSLESDNEVLRKHIYEINKRLWR